MTTMPPVLRAMLALMSVAACVGGSPAAHAESSRSWLYSPPSQAVKDAAAQRAARLAMRTLKAAPGSLLLNQSADTQQADCSAATKDWVAWRRQTIHDLLAPISTLEGRPGPFLNSDRVTTESVALANFLDQCASGLEGTLGDPVENLRKFVGWQSVNLATPHLFGHGPEVTDKEYVKRVQSITTLPCLLQSAPFLKNISNKATYRAALQMVDQQNDGKDVAGCRSDGKKWRTLFYQSSVLGTPPPADAFGRFLVVVPGDTHAQWIQFGIWAPGETVTGPINNVSVVAAARIGAPSAQAFNAAIDWWRVYAADGGITIDTRFSVTGKTGNCQNCHKTPVIGIHPKDVYEFRGKSKALTRLTSDLQRDRLLQAINTDIGEAYAAPTAVTGAGDSYADPQNYGPPLGPVMQRDPQFLKSCTAPYRLTPQSVKRVADRMDCESCHAHDDMGAINFPMATQRTTATRLTNTTWPNLVYAYVMRGLMPSDQPPLTLMAERKALFNCLTLEYHDPQKRTGVLADWLNQAPKKLALRPQDTPELMARVSSTAAKARPLATPQDNPPPSGKTDFEARCARCHSTLVGINKRGPSLFGVVGRASGATTFAYSASYLEAGKPEVGVLWDEANLMQFLIDDSAFLTLKLGHADTSKMNKQFADEPLRRRIVDYLMTLK